MSEGSFNPVMWGGATLEEAASQLSQYELDNMKRCLGECGELTARRNRGEDPSHELCDDCFGEYVDTLDGEFLRKAGA